MECLEMVEGVVEGGGAGGKIQDSADISQARINPALLMSSERTSYDDKPRGVSVGGRPPGYLSEGDWIVLERYNGLNEPRLDIHEQSMCPGDSGKELKIA